MADATTENLQELPEPDDEHAEPSGPPASVLEPGTSRFAPRWWMKTLAFAVVLIAFGSWGLYDALVAYPERGIADAEHKQLEYLRAWATSGRLGDPSVAEPAAELERLKERSRQPSMMSQADPLRLRWLIALDKVARLTPEHTRIDSPSERLQELEQAWTTKTPPKELSAYDIPAQWIFVAVGYTVGPWLLLRFAGVMGKKYRWDPDGKKLTIPGGHTITPADLEDVDRRKWDKFIVFLKINASHGALAGQEVKIDLYHYTQSVEDWVVALEHAAFPDRAIEDAEEEAEDRDDDSPADDPPADGEPRP